ncbi:bifunctional [glutamate--ammonia ligase]-adenylyl-L-tyrosine phosphorylase/[glutamate--ammonia-ligase] adenylyltransferase [Thalassotalea sp. LPB0316]|uniref:bifunctional [glutamate--ammonia ligase]-adenylyl-L-tyrosine phosphorylase/[glutamate--ammonia-ligase] adenylyltransferase n=1 Tax=Thalassotalea sp. LPB0316 TaxID=2769490 RepID=UPI001D038436|nr:bifunctional [glutamate--ammonia ligase]-adenylyl-L-tyrosine phosphorylase/[glutamate--ammonia-ligase] adenylyltransferase [Thalassotalea sp. LPB0316]
MPNNPMTDLAPAIVEKSQRYWQLFLEQMNTAEAVEISQDIQPIIQAGFGLSDFIYRVAMQMPSEFVALVSTPDFYVLAKQNYQTNLQQRLSQCQSEQQLHQALRQFRQLAMTRIAFADLVFEQPLKQCLQALSELADNLINQALEWLHNDCQVKWGQPVNAQGKPQQLLVYAMGKLGGKELNFSSDIDLIFTYPEAGETIGARKSIDNHQYFTRLGQKLITALNQQTADGFVYRVDMRLRPFGESGPLVMSFNALEDYYQEQGRDWERYAMLKARLIGQSDYHEQLQIMLRPFVFRRYIDFSVIESLRKMKMMIAQEARRKRLHNNIKLGAGGIREIEFIVQVFQLIRGGRKVELQERNLLSVLPKLVKHGELSKQSADTLEQAYCFLRRAENIIQALNDEQTQTLPDIDLNQQRLICVMGFASWSAFLEQLKIHMDAVHNEFNLLIGEESPKHSGDDHHWQNIWLSLELESDLTGLIHEHAPNIDAEHIAKVLVEFRQELSKRSIGPRGRQMFDKLMPRVLLFISQEQQASLILARVITIFNRISTRTAYLELLYENEGALKQLIKLCLASEWISEYIAKFPILLDELIDPKLLHNPPSLSSYLPDLQLHLLRIPEEDVEAQMDGLRHFKQAQQLRIAAADVSGVLPLMKVSDHLTALAAAILHEVIHQAWSHTSRRFGIPSSLQGTDDKGLVVIGYGKMGGIELGYSSDLDLVFLHNIDANELTNGEKQVPATQFYMKLAQRIMHIFNTRMASGMLYELDMRLRPSGNSGMLVVHMDNFLTYQQEEAWTWEHQALVRARGIYGESTLVDKFNDIRQQILTQPRQSESLLKDVVEMREKMRQHLDLSSSEAVSLKHGKGGLVDIEFLAQYLVLKHAHQSPKVCIYSDNIRIFESLVAEQIISENDAELLIQTYQLLRNQGHIATLQNIDSATSEPNILAMMAKTHQLCSKLLTS